MKTTRRQVQFERLHDAREFHSTAELLDSFSQYVNGIQQRFGRRIGSLDEIAEKSISQNTYRGLHDFDPGPKEVFTAWAREKLRSDRFQQCVLCPDQPAYNKWLEELAGRLREHWPTMQKPPRGIEYGQSRKLTNLLMKHYALWTGLTESTREQLIDFLHVPLDEYVLIGIRTCIGEYPHYSVEIPSNPSMSAVKDKKMYYRIQGALRHIAGLANVPAIYLDVFFWDLNHRERA